MIHFLAYLLYTDRIGYNFDSMYNSIFNLPLYSLDQVSLSNIPSLLKFWVSMIEIHSKIIIIIFGVDQISTYVQVMKFYFHLVCEYGTSYS